MPRDPRGDQRAQACELGDLEVIGCLFPERIARIGQLLGAGQARLKREANAGPVVLERPSLKRAQHQHVHDGDAWVWTNRHVERGAHTVTEEGLRDPHALHVAAAGTLHFKGHGAERGVPIIRHTHHCRLQRERMRGIDGAQRGVGRRDGVAAAADASGQGDEPEEIEGNRHAAQAPKLTAKLRFHAANVTGDPETPARLSARQRIA